MKKTFTKDYILVNRGCYTKRQVEALKCINNKRITLKQLFRDLPTRDFCWWLIKKCDLNFKERIKLAIHVAEFVLPIFEEKYPDDDRPRKAIEAAKVVTENNTEKNRRDAYAASSDACSAAYAADAAADAAYAAAYAASSDACSAAHDACSAAYAAVSYVVYAASSDASNAADAYYAASAYREHVWKFVEELMKTK